MNQKRKQLFIAILVGVVAVALNHIYVSNQIEQAGPGKKISVVRAKKQIAAGTTLTSALVERVRVPNYQKVDVLASSYVRYRLYIL